MEKVISPEERLKRAEEIYYRRRAQGVRVTTTSVNVGKQNKVSLGKKMIIQILICSCIYTVFWLIKGYDNVFSESVINNTKNILNYDINFENLYKQCMEYFNNNFNSIFNVNAGSKNVEREGNENVKDNIIDDNESKQTLDIENQVNNESDSESQNKEENRNENNENNEQYELQENNQENMEIKEDENGAEKRN